MLFVCGKWKRKEREKEEIVKYTDGCIDTHEGENTTKNNSNHYIDKRFVGETNN